MKWIKCKEKLPEQKKVVIVAIVEVDFYGIIDKFRYTFSMLNSNNDWLFIEGFAPFGVMYWADFDFVPVKQHARFEMFGMPFVLAPEVTEQGSPAQSRPNMGVKDEVD